MARSGKSASPRQKATATQKGRAFDKAYGPLKRGQSLGLPKGTSSAYAAAANKEYRKSGSSKRAAQAGYDADQRAKGSRSGSKATGGNDAG